MKTYSLLLFAILQPFVIAAQDEKPVDTKVASVTVFLNNAQVTRELKTRIEAGKSSVVVRGLSSMLDQKSIQVSGKGNFTILGIAHRQNFLNEFNTPRSLSVLKDSLDFVQRQINLEQSEKEILNKEEQMLISNQKIGGANQNLTVAELKAMADFYRSRLTEIVTARMRQDITIRKLTEKQVRLQRQINEQNDLYSRNTSEIVITLTADAPAQADLTVSYVVGNAGWYAVYDLRATDTKSPVQLSYKANVFQSTGEDWRNVKLKLSTANPTLGGLKPELYTWYLDFYRADYAALLQGRVAGVERKRAMPSAPRKAEELEQSVAMEAAPAETTASFVSTVQTSLNTEFDIALPYTIPSSSRPTLVDIRVHDLKADYTYSVAPKLDRDAFLMAHATGWEEFSLLPGEANIFFEGTFVGASHIDPNNIKDTLAISLGRDKRIVVKREKMKDFSSRKLIGSNQRDSYAFEISVRNTKNEVVNLTVEDQVPISKNSQIEVTLTDAGNAKYNKDSGKLTWQLVLQPNETRKVAYKYEVKYPKDQNVAGLD